MKHTRPPFKISTRSMACRVDFGATTDDDNWGWATIEGMHKEANAAFIVKACNLHDELVEAVREAERSLAFAGFNETAPGKMRRIRAVLKKAGEE